MNNLTPDELAKKVIDKMYHSDPFSQWLGINRIEEGPGYCTLRATVKKDMLNGFSIAHGGITYSLADSALAFASNSHGKKAVSIETSISHLLSCKENDVLTAKTTEMNLSYKIGIYQVVVQNQHDERVALFKGTVYRKQEDWF